MKRDYLLFAVIALVILFLDQASKWLVLTYVEPHRILPIIPGFFNVVLVKNRGMAFGLLGQTRSGFYCYLLVAATLGAMGAILFIFLWIKERLAWMTVGLSLVLGGAAGNLMDRLRLGHVIDFLDFSIKGYHWPAFNVADSAVTVGTLWLLLHIIREKTPSEQRH